MSDDTPAMSWSGDLFQGLGTHKPKPLLEDLLPQEQAPDILEVREEPVVAVIEKPKVAIVIDTNVLIKRIALRDLYPLPEGVEFDSRYTVHTLKDVFRELKDEQARQYVENLPFQLEVHENVESKYFEFVRRFAKETGDFKSLSYTDLRVMALGLQLCEQQGEFERVQTKPKELTEFKPKRFEDDYKKLEDATAGSDSEESEGSAEEEDSDSEDEGKRKANKRGKNPSEGVGFDDFQPVQPKKHGDRKNHIQPKPSAVQLEQPPVEPVVAQ